MAAPYKWTVRDVDVNLVRRLRVLALLRGQPVAKLLNEALVTYLEREEVQSQTTPDPRSSPSHR
jgi:predicted transcriptional regulator